MALDTFQDIEARLVSHDFVLKCLINTVNQINPQAGLGPAIIQMLDNSVKNVGVSGEVEPALLQELRDRILSHSKGIVNDGLGAKPNS